jgi:hypothetical protein
MKTTSGLASVVAKKAVLSDEIKGRLTQVKRLGTGLRAVLSHVGAELIATDRKALQDAAMVLRKLEEAYAAGHRIKKQDDELKAARLREAKATVQRVFSAITTIDDRVALMAANESWRFQESALQRWCGRHARSEAEDTMGRCYSETLDSIAYRVSEGQDIEQAANDVLSRFQSMRPGLHAKYEKHIAAIKQALEQ